MKAELMGLPVHQHLQRTLAPTPMYFLTLLVALVAEWRARRPLKKLREYPDVALDDVGITREALDQALALPLTVDAGLALSSRWRA